MDKKFEIIFDKAKNQNCATGYNKMFERSTCKKCNNFTVIEGYKACMVDGYPIPIIGKTNKRKCAGFKGVF